MALDTFNPYLFVSAGEQSNKFLTPTYADGIAQFQAQRAQSLTGLTVRIDPIQEGTGDPYPPGGGVNKLNLAECNPRSGAYGLTITISGDEVVLSGTYTGKNARAVFRLFQYSDSRVISYNAKGFAADSATSLNFDGNLDKADDDTVITVTLTNMVQNTAYTLRIKPVLYEGSTAPAAWSPYSNICPISGRTGLTVTRAGKNLLPTIDATYPVTWQTQAGTVYGGTLDVISGVLTVDRAIVDMGTLNYTYDSSGGRFYTSVSGKKNESSDSEMMLAISSMYKPMTATAFQSNPTNGTMRGATTGGYVYFRNNAYTDAASFKTAMAGQTLCYKLATPQTYQLTPTEVMTLAGFNQVYSDAGPIIDIKF